MLCQITSNPYSDPLAVELADASFQEGTLRVLSYARPGKLFTANREIMVECVGRLKAEPFGNIVQAVIDLLRGRSSASRK